MFFGLFGNRYTADPEVGAALDYLIERIDPRLTLVGGCRRTLGRPVQRALEFARSLVVQLPAPIALRAQSWSSEPRLRAFFARPGDIGEVLAHGPGVREYFDAGRDEGFAVLRMTRKQARVLAQALQGEMIQREVPRTSVSFTEHHVSPPCATAEALARDLERRALEFIAERVAGRLGARDADRKALEQERDVLKARMRLAGRGGHGLEPAADGQALAASLKKCEARLTELAGGLNDRVSMVAATLAAPEKELQLAVHTLRLDQMNFVVDEGEAVCAEVTFVEATASEERSRVLVPVQVFRSELAPARDALADGDKLL
jgi:hypothetical protein